MANIARAFRERFPGAQVVKRTKNSIHVETSPGHFVAEINSGVIHYGPNADLECDTAWVPAVAPWQHQMLMADYRAQAKAAFNGAPLIQYTHALSGQFVTLQPRQLDYSNDRGDVQMLSAVQNVTATIDDDTLLWQGAYGAGRDFRWQASTDRLAKALILQTAAAAPTPSAQVLGGANPILRLAYTFAFSSGVTPHIDGVAWNPNQTVTTAGAIEFRDSGGNVLWRFAVPGAIDANGNPAPGLVQRLSRSGPNLLCEVRVPWAFLATAAYPVEIDPTLVLQPDTTAGKDGRIISDTPNTVYDDGFLSHGRFSAVRYRHLIQFDLSSLASTVTVDSATLTYKCFDATVSNDTVRYYRVLRAWVEAELTWNNARSGVAWGTAGCDNTTTDRESDSIGSMARATTDVEGTEKTVTLTAALVQGWIDGDLTNNGLLGKGDNESTDSSGSVKSSNDGTSTNRPKLVIEYTEAAAGVPRQMMHYRRMRQ